MTAALIGLVSAGTVGALILRRAPVARLAKMTASTGFVAIAVAAGALDSSFGTAILVGLGLAWAGDLFLTFSGSRAFLAGLAAFLTTHVVYIVAFGLRGVDVSRFAVAGVAMAVIAVALGRWILPGVDHQMRAAVIAYIAVISAMVAAAAGTHGAMADGRIIVGSIAFVLSDVGVARERFVAPGPANRIAGLPLYFCAQTLLALAAGG